MRNLMKLITIALMTALLICMVITCASADDKIYTSPVFKLPAERLQEAKQNMQQAEPEAETEPQEEPGEVTEPQEEPGEVTEPQEEPGEVTEPQEEPGEVTEPQEEPGEVTEPQEEPAEGTEPEAEPEILAGDTVQKKREVRIYSSQGEVVTEYEQIKLSSELIGFEGLTVTYQWQVDRGDGEGWVDVEGATRENHVFRATRETIQYSWRLIVNIVDGE